MKTSIHIHLIKGFLGKLKHSLMKINLQIQNT